MSKCQFKKDGWECPLDAEEGHDFCYWHQEIEGKKPNDEQLNELKIRDIRFIFLQEAYLFEANLQEANLQNANLQEADLQDANLQEANLWLANLQEANLDEANLQEANLDEANLQKANLDEANLQEAYLFEANLQKANLWLANLQKANLWLANLQEAKLYRANLQNAILRETKLQGAYLFETLSNSNTYLMDANLKDANLYRSFLDSTKSLRYSIIFEEENLNEREINELLADKEIHREKKYELYQQSLEVYSKLYRFYSDEGMDFRAKHAHYRRAEVKRKLLLAKHEKWYAPEAWTDTFMAAFDGLILKTLTGHGESLKKPAWISVFWIFAFAVFFRLVNGIEVTGRNNITPLDYLYLSLTTFTGLGFSNVQPDISMPYMQILVMMESVLGVTMVALIIFVVTYRITR